MNKNLLNKLNMIEALKSDTKIIETEADSEDNFIKLALSLGQPIKSRENGNIIDTLISLKSEEVNRDSLSKRYGLNSFPIHTDCAYLSIPPKYILLRYIGSIKKPSPTIVIDFDISKLNKIEIDFITRKMWFIRSKGKGFYSPILKNNILRYDEEVMSMVNIGENRMRDISLKMKEIKIDWHTNKVAIIKNHEALHYRPSLLEKEQNKRILQRINIL